jgi:hypothetical protein
MVEAARGTAVRIVLPVHRLRADEVAAGAEDAELVAAVASATRQPLGLARKTAKPMSPAVPPLAIVTARSTRPPRVKS